MEIPNSMRFIDHAGGGAADVMVVAQMPVPEPAANEVLIRVAWTGVNRPDIAQRSGSYPPPADASPVLGLEVSGHVVAIGDAVGERFQLQDPVCALTNGGAYAEYVCVPAGQVLPVPAGMALRDAAGLAENYFTVYANLIEGGRLKPGETVLIHGGSSGIGLTAIQMAKAWGASVFTTVGNPEKMAACLALGADEAINYREQDFVEVIADKTGGKGVDVILDMVGGDYIARNLRSLALEGRLVQIAFLQGAKADINWLPLMVKRLTFTGSTMRARPEADKQRIAQALLEKIWPHLEAGKVLPKIHSEFELADAEKAHLLMESSTHIGKIVMRVGG